MFDSFKLILNINQNMLDIQLEVNDIRISPDLVINLFSLAKSCQNGGEFYIFTCVCGEPKCANIYKGVSVTQLPNKIVWDLDIDSIEHQFTFDPILYKKNIDQVIFQLKELHTNHKRSISLAIFGQRWQDLLNLDT